MYHHRPIPNHFIALSCSALIKKYALALTLLLYHITSYAQTFPECYMMDSFQPCTVTLTDGTSRQGNLNILLTKQSVVMAAGGDTTIIAEDRDVVKLAARGRLFLRTGRAFAEVMDMYDGICLGRELQAEVWDPAKEGAYGFTDASASIGYRRADIADRSQRKHWVRKPTLVFIHENKRSIVSLKSAGSLFADSREEIKALAQKFGTDFTDLGQVKTLLDAALIEPLRIESEKEWAAFSEKGGNPADYIREHHPMYARRCSNVMTVLDAEYKARQSDTGDSPDFDTFLPDIEERLRKKCIRTLETEGKVTVNGFRNISMDDGCRFHSLYGRYNCIMDDGHANFWSDADMVRKTGLDFGTMDKTACCVECGVEKDGRKETTLLYFDKNCEYLFRIDTDL